MHIHQSTRWHARSHRSGGSDFHSLQRNFFRRTFMNSRYLKSLVLISAGLALAQASLAGEASSQIPLLVQATLSGQGMTHAPAPAAVNAAASIDALTLTRAVLSGIGSPRKESSPAVRERTTEGAGGAALRADALQIVRRTLSGRAG
jgi:hypothetical protein